MIHIFLLLFRHSAFGAVVQSSYTDLILNQNWVYTPYMEEYFWTQTLDSLSPDTRRTINLNVRLDNTQQNNTLAAFVSATCVEISPKSDCFKDGSSVVFARICNGTTLRIPRTETWDFWTALEQYDRVVNPPRPWNSIDFKSLKSELVNNQRGKLYFLDGIRKAYLDIPLTSELTHSIDQWFKISKNSSLSICLRNPSQQVRLGDFKARKPVAIIPSSNTFTETRMRVFFDPGWRFTTYIKGFNLMADDRLSIKVSGCRGSMEQRAMRISKPIRAYKTKLLPQYNNSYNPLIDVLNFELHLDSTEEIDSTSDWRRVTYILRRLSRPTVTTTIKPYRIGIRNPTRNKLNDPSVYAAEFSKHNICRRFLKLMSVCYYANPSDQNGQSVGFTQLNLASSDAAEFVAFSIFLLLGLPVSFMWTLGCLGFKHRKLRVELRRMRLTQQREQVEQRLARYLGFAPKEYYDDSASSSNQSDDDCYSRLNGDRGGRLPESPLL